MACPIHSPHATPQNVHNDTSDISHAIQHRSDVLPCICMILAHHPLIPLRSSSRYLGVEHGDPICPFTDDVPNSFMVQPTFSFSFSSIQQPRLHFLLVIYLCDPCTCAHDPNTTLDRWIFRHELHPDGRPNSFFELRRMVFLLLLLLPSPLFPPLFPIIYFPASSFPTPRMGVWKKLQNSGKKNKVDMGTVASQTSTAN